jgi:hypothetical protein
MPTHNTNKNQKALHTRNNAGSISKLKESCDSSINSAIIEDKQANSAQSYNFKPKPIENEIIMESQEKRSCCKLNNCSIF